MEDMPLVPVSSRNMQGQSDDTTDQNSLGKYPYVIYVSMKNWARHFIRWFPWSDWKCVCTALQAV